MDIDCNLNKASIFLKPDKLIIRSLDSKNLQIVGAIMGQTVALEYYADSVDRLVYIYMHNIFHAIVLVIAPMHHLFYLLYTLLC